MDNKGITIYQMSRLSKVKYDIIKKYYNADAYSINIEILAKFCYILDCKVEDLIVYNLKND